MNAKNIFLIASIFELIMTLLYVGLVIWTGSSAGKIGFSIGALSMLFACALHLYFYNKLKSN